MSEHNMGHLKYLDVVAMSDAELVKKKEATYMGSWKRAGGRSAWFMFRRNMDRLMQMLAPPRDEIQFSLLDLNDVIEESEESALEKGGDCTVDFSVMKYLRDSFIAEDIFRQIESDPNSGADGTVLACLRDLRCYAMLIEAEMINRGVLRAPDEVKVLYEAPQTDTYGLIAAETGRTRKEVKDMIHDLFYKPKTPENMTRARTLDPIRSEIETITTKRVGDISLTESVVERTFQPRTPEDGGQHAALVPWLVPFDYFAKQKISPEFYNKFWRELGRSGMWVLEAYVESHTMPVGLRSCYDLRGNSWVIKLDRCPADLREYFPNLSFELNMKEWEELPSYQKPLYTWLTGGNKYQLAEQNVAWRKDQ